MIELLISHEVVVICLGGGGMPVAAAAGGALAGVEAVIDKDLASSLLVRQIRTDALVMLNDVEAVFAGWNTPEALPLRCLSQATATAMSFEPGSMAPKVEAACRFCAATGGFAGIGRLSYAAAIIEGRAGTRIVPGATKTLWW